MPIRNTVTNPNALGGTASLENEASTSVAMSAANGRYTVTSGATTQATARLALTQRPAGASGQTWGARATLTNPASTARSVSLVVVFYSGTGSTIGSVLGTAVSTQTLSASGIGSFSVSGVAPAGTASVGLQVRREAGTGATSSDVVWASALFLVQITDGTATVPPYGDPNTDPTHWFWDGAANASTSYKVLNTPKLTLIDDDVNGPRVLVLVPEGVPGTQTVTLSRTAGGRTMRVRGGVGLYAVGGASALDAEVPFGVPVTYQAEQFDGTGQSLGFTDASPITVNEALTWVSQPLSPGSAMRVRLRVGSTASLTRPSPGEVVVPEGATVGRIISGQRSGVHGTLVLSVGSPAQADAFDALWGGYGQDFPAVICIRTPPNVPLPPVLFWACLAPERQSSGANKAIRYVLPGSEVAPPSAGLVIPTLRRKDIDAAYPTRAARAAAYQSRIQRDTDYTKAGLAGP